MGRASKYINFKTPLQKFFINKFTYQFHDKKREKIKIDEKGEKHTVDDVKHQVMSCFSRKRKNIFPQFSSVVKEREVRSHGYISRITK